MKLVIERQHNTVSYDVERERGLSQTLGFIHVVDGDDIIYTAHCLERPHIKDIPSVSRLPEGQYDFQVINKSPKSTMGHIYVNDKEWLITPADYLEADHVIMVGERIVDHPTHLGLDKQVDAVSKLCSLLPVKGIIQVFDLFD